MSKNLTDVDEFSTPINVPEGLDDHDDAAGDVERVAQRLANRTHHLNVHAAKKDAANEFTEPQIFSDGVEISDLTVTGDAAIPNISGNVEVVGDLVATRLDATGDLYAGDDVIAQDEFQYGPPIMRTVQVNLNGLSAPGVTEYTNGEGLGIEPAGIANVPLHLPHGAALHGCTVKLSGAGISYEIRARRKHTINMAAATLPTTASVDTVSGTTVATVENVSVNFGGLTVSKDERYWVTIYNSTGGSLGVAAVSMTFTDPGPRNH